ncbi:MAG: hypothetical protein AAFN74_11960 [Myxococcota bacterium]
MNPPADSGVTPPPTSSDRLRLSEATNIDGLFFSQNGDIFAAEGFNGTKIFRITDDGTVTTYADGLSGPIDIAEDDDGNLYVTNFLGSSVSRVRTDGTVEAFAQVDPFPAGIVRAPDGQFYVSIYGAADLTSGLGTGTIIHEISADGTVTEFSSGGELMAPVGIDLGPDGTVYTANFHDGRVIAIAADGSQTVLASLLSEVEGLGIGHVAIAQGKLYATSISGLEVLSVDITDSSVTSVANAPRPNGITFVPDSATLFVAAGNTETSSLRKVQLTQ